jgi:hypothetical protein
MASILLSVQLDANGTMLALFQLGCNFKTIYDNQPWLRYAVDFDARFMGTVRCLLYRPGCSVKNILRQSTVAGSRRYEQSELYTTINSSLLRQHVRFECDAMWTVGRRPLNRYSRNNLQSTVSVWGRHANANVTIETIYNNQSQS